MPAYPFRSAQRVSPGETEAKHVPGTLTSPPISSAASDRSIRHKLLQPPTKRVNSSQETHLELNHNESNWFVHPTAVLPVRPNQNRNGWRRSSASALASAAGVSMLIQRAAVTQAWTVSPAAISAGYVMRVTL